LKAKCYSKWVDYSLCIIRNGLSLLGVILIVSSLFNFFKQVTIKIYVVEPHVCQLESLAGKHDIVVHQVVVSPLPQDGCVLIDAYSIAAVVKFGGLSRVQLKGGTTYIYVEESVEYVHQAVVEAKTSGYS
jgi:hypothetical protein